MSIQNTASIHAVISSLVLNQVFIKMVTATHKF